MNNKKQIGILALQGSFVEHAKILDKIGVKYLFVRTKVDLGNISHLIIPGGESTTMEKLLKEYRIWDEIMHRVGRQKVKSEELKVKNEGTFIENDPLFIFGTCAGAILCEKFGADFEIDRNAYGAQQDSFIGDLDSEKIPKIKGVFIRAPRFKKIGKDVRVLASYKDEPVLIETGNFLAATFHPEISGDVRVHEYFLADF